MDVYLQKKKKKLANRVTSQKGEWRYAESNSWVAFSLSRIFFFFFFKQCCGSISQGRIKVGELVLAFTPAAQDRSGATKKKNIKGSAKTFTINSRSVAVMKDGRI